MSDETTPTTSPAFRVIQKDEQNRVISDETFHTDSYGVGTNGNHWDQNGFTIQFGKGRKYDTNGIGSYEAQMEIQFPREFLEFIISNLVGIAGNQNINLDIKDIARGVRR